MNEGLRNPSDPREWLRRARSNLERAGVLTPNSYKEDACFDAQQTAEKAIKVVLVWHHIPFPYVHDLAVCLASRRRRAFRFPRPSGRQARSPNTLSEPGIRACPSQLQKSSGSSRARLPSVSSNGLSK